MDANEELPSLRWSRSFTIQPSSSTSSNVLQGDKIILPQSALEQLLAAAPAPALNAISSNPFGSSAGSFGGQSHAELPHPLMFRLVNPNNNNIVYAGIREFSAPEDTLVLSPFLKDALGVKEEEAADTPTDTTSEAPAAGPQITVHARQLPRGTYVRLRPLEAGYNPDDWKSLLERQFRESYTTLTKDTIISVQGVHGDEFKFLVDKFAPDGDGICVVDTDLEVDIEALNEEQARETMRQIMTRAQASAGGEVSQGGLIDIWKESYGEILPGNYIEYELPSWDRSYGVSIELSDVGDADALDLFITPKSAKQRASPRDSVHVFGDFSPAQEGRKRITIPHTNAEMEDAESLLVAVHAYNNPAMPRSDPISFTIRARKDISIATWGSGIAQHAADEEQCKNCLQSVPKQSMVLHGNFCRRNNVACPKCKSVFKKASEEWEEHWHCEHDDAYGSSVFSKLKHDDIFHTDRRCPSCEFSTNSLADLARHRSSVCPGKIILCRFCHLEVPQEGDPFMPSPEVLMSGLTAHELADGARTTECHLCEKIVRLRDMEVHLKHHDMDKANRSPPQICRNRNCGRTLHGVGPRGQINVNRESGSGTNKLGLCSVCYAPFHVSMHDPDGTAMRRRIERRYLGQMMKGCGKPHCFNEMCRTGMAKQGYPDTGPLTLQEAVPLVKPVLRDIDNMMMDMHFCVDEANHLRRTAAETLLVEGYDLEWCVAAAEAERGDLDRMREWLKSWAPRTKHWGRESSY